jgi:hypothetical protein
MTKKAETATIRISKRAAELMREIAAAEGCTPRQYLEALLHYGASCHKRPGSWEASNTHRPRSAAATAGPDNP